ncbi:insulin-induced gene 1 protein-like [Coturnix japonica]|uniref:insulin-induced gene 1 protein-like n=1 Tax=Coturnix japonica TaxID=93934 RepID=UPI000777C01A|nr:insulin-induced gene 1 protein-like [Coturnix japonica]
MPRLESGSWSCSCAARARHAARPGEAALKAGAMRSPSPSAGRAVRDAAGCSATTWRQHLVQRSLVLFVVGAFMALVLNLLQIQRNVTLFPDEVIATLFSSAWWVPPCCGTAAGECGVPPIPPHIHPVYRSSDRSRPAAAPSRLHWPPPNW